MYYGDGTGASTTFICWIEFFRGTAGSDELGIARMVFKTCDKDVFFNSGFLMNTFANPYPSYADTKQWSVDG